MEENLSTQHDQIQQTGEKRKASGDDQEIQAPSKELLPDILSRLRITKFSSALQDMGVESTDDLAYLEDADLEKIGIATIPRRKLLEAAGRDWRSKNEPKLDAQVEPKLDAQVEPKPDAQVEPNTDVKVEPEMDAQVEPKPDTQVDIQPKSPVEKKNIQVDLEQEDDGLGEEREEDHEGDDRDGEKKNEVGEREDGEGCENEEEENGFREVDEVQEAEGETAVTPFLPSQPDGELKQLLMELHDRLEDFAAVNGLDGAARAFLAQLPARVALRAIGLLGRDNAFVMQGVRRTSGALLSRSRAAAREEGQTILAGKPAGQPYEDWPRLLDGFASVNNLGESLRNLLDGLSRDQALQVMGFTSNLRFLVPADGGDAEFEVAARVRMAKAGSKLLPVLPRTLTSQWMCRLMTRETSDKKCHLNSDVAPFWQRNLDTFKQVNNLDDQVAGQLSNLTKIEALRVMGLVGHTNSFLIRDARDPTAVARQRIMKAKEACGSDEPYAHFSRLVEDFVTLNCLDQRSAEAMRSLSMENALQVMGFTAENAFVIRGVNNPSAALMARILVAQQINRKPR